MLALVMSNVLKTIANHIRKCPVGKQIYKYACNKSTDGTFTSRSHTYREKKIK